MNKIKNSPSFFSGLSGLNLNIPLYHLPEQFQNSSRLAYYASLFNSIEINSSFYKIPQGKTIAKWTSEVRDDFRFTFKLFKEVTHNKALDFNNEFVREFIQSINFVQHKKGCILIQFPPGTGIEYISKLENLLNCIESQNTGWKIAVEFRNKSWYHDATFHLLNAFQAALVIHDIPKSATPMFNHTSFIYVRFHGPTGNYRDSYSEDFLSEYATYVNNWHQEGKTVYMYFNNTMGDAFNNLIAINGMIG